MADIVLIEDGADLRQEIWDFLVRRKHTVRVGGRLEEARRILAERAPDAVVSDINLPDGDGAMFCAEQALLLPGTMWLVMSGDPKAADRSRRLLGRDERRFVVLNKPVPMQVLSEFVRRAESSQSGLATASVGGQS